MTENDFARQPWASGPAEILEHGLELLAVKDSDRNRRLAIISIDNAVELMIKTYLNLPARVTGLKISRKDTPSFARAFPCYLTRWRVVPPKRWKGSISGKWSGTTGSEMSCITKATA